MKIKVTKNGPYIVSGNVPLFEKALVKENGLMALKLIRRIDIPEGEYALCRCGKSSTPPFCNGNHVKYGFDGTETADRRDYVQRVQVIEGEAIDLLDDDRCAFARFCHKHRGDVWTLTENSGDAESRREAEEAAGQCPTGRLTIMSKEGRLQEPHLEPSISIVQDHTNGVSAGLFVTGGIALEDPSGEPYELRNRMALCRCGESENKPFCDASHINADYQDGLNS